MRQCVLTVVFALGIDSHTLHAQLDTRAHRAMGFDQDRTAHHFVLRTDGGIISVEVKDSSDDASRDAIRRHIRRIASDFEAGRFDAPLETHGEEPPGVPMMRALRSSIRYIVEQMPGGARVRIASSNNEVVAAIHDFLRYQIREHHTGDSTESP